MKHLTQGTRIRLPRWDEMTFATVGDTFAEPDPERREVMLANNRRHNAPDAFATYAGAAITANPAFYAQKRHEAATAVTIEPGEQLIVGQRVYEVEVTSRQDEHRPVYSNPVRFRPIGPSEYSDDTLASMIETVKGSLNAHRQGWITLGREDIECLKSDYHFYRSEWDRRA